LAIFSPGGYGRHRRQIEKFQDLKDDGSTACGAWLYCGVFPKQYDPTWPARAAPTGQTALRRISAGPEPRRPIAATPRLLVANGAAISTKAKTSKASGGKSR